MVFGERLVCRRVDERRARDEHAGRRAAGGAQTLDQVMRAADVDRECRFGRFPRAPDVRGAGAVIDDATAAAAASALANAGRVEQIDRLPVDAAAQPLGPGDRRPRLACRQAGATRRAGRRIGCAASRSSRWLPANPAAPVTRVGRHRPVAQRGTSPHRAVERREVAEAGQRERQEEAIVGTGRRPTTP